MATAHTKKDVSKLPVLVLNSIYQAINVVTAKRAILLVLNGIASVEEVSGEVLRSGRGYKMPIPSVVRLFSYRKIPAYRYSLSRKNIILRDHSTCQYCAKKLPASELTMDHVTPRSKNGGNTWHNLVACCKPCNNKKGDRTPEEAGMTLMHRPKPASIHTNRMLLRMNGHLNPVWQKYLYY